MKYIALLLLVVAPACAAATPPIARFAGEIVRRQAADGAIVMGTLTPTDNKVVPYFANLAATGLVTASRDSGDKRYLSAAKRWALWYAAHMNADGTTYDYSGAPGAWVSKGDFDSTDSYAGTYIELLERISTLDKPWIGGRYASVGKAVKAIRLTLQPNGLTLAKPKYPVMYLMDNVETARGLRAAAHIAKITHHAGDAKTWTSMAVRMESAIESRLWDESRNAYFVGIQPDGGRDSGNGEWYPDVMANLLAVAWGVPSARHRELYKHLAAASAALLPAAARSEDDLDRVAWWGLAARASGDTARAKTMANLLMGFDPGKAKVYNTALLGHACRLLSR
jgi:hypothetical protein